jgi:hypothetical protein
MTQNFNRPRDARRTKSTPSVFGSTGQGTLGQAVVLSVLGALASTAMFACARPNPRFNPEGEPADGTGSTGRLAGTSGEPGATDFETDGPNSSDDTGFETDGSTARLVVFASEPSNGSLDFEGETESLQADAHCALIDSDRDIPRCDGTIRAFVFVAPVPTGPRIPEQLELPSDRPVDAPNGSRIANSLSAFATGPHLTTLTDADVVPSTTTAVWTGLNPSQQGNCQGWTSGNGERLGGAGELHGEQGWATAKVESCEDEFPILCLCEAASL